MRGEGKRCPRLLLGLALLVAGPVAGAVAAPADPAAQAGPAAAATDPASPEGLQARLLAALEAGNLENALYAYRSLYHVTGKEAPALLGRVARLSLQREMRSGRGWIRVTAAELLARRGDERAVKVLRDVVADESVPSSQRIAALRTLGETGDAESTALLAAVAHDAERPFRERLAAADALLAQGDISGVPDLMIAVRSDDPRAYEQAIRILADREVVATEVLRRAADSGNERIELQALRGLALQEDAEALARLREMFGEDPPLVIPELRAKAPEGESGSRVYYDYREVQRLHALGRVLLELGDPRPLNYFAALAGDIRSPVNPAAVAGLMAPLDRERAVRILRDLLAGEGRPAVAITAARELAELGETEGVLAALAAGYRLTRDENDDANRLLAVKAVAALGSKDSESVLRDMLSDPSGIHRVFAAEGLCRLGDAEGFRALRRILDGGDRIDALEAARVLMDLNPETAPG